MTIVTRLTRFIAAPKSLALAFGLGALALAQGAAADSWPSNGTFTLPYWTTTLTPSGVQLAATNPVAFTSSGQTYAFQNIENLTFPGSATGATYAEGLNNDYTVTGNASNDTGGDILSADYDTTFNGVTGTVPLGGGFQAGVYITNSNGAAFTTLRGLINHFRNYSTAAVGSYYFVQPVFDENAGTITTMIAYSCPTVTSGVAGGGSVGTYDCVDNTDPNGVIYNAGTLAQLGNAQFNGSVVLASSAQLSETPGSTIIAAAGTTTPFYTFSGYTSDGLVHPGTSTPSLALQVNGADYYFNANQMYAAAATGFQLNYNANCSSTTPTLIPTQSDKKAGFGCDSNGDVTLIADVSSTATVMAKANATGLVVTAGVLTPPSYTVSTLPASPATGSIAVVTDATSCTFGGALTGSGSTKCPAYYNGSAWVGG